MMIKHPGCPRAAGAEDGFLALRLNVLSFSCQLRHEFKQIANEADAGDLPTASTILHDTRTPLVSWFYAMYLFCTTRHVGVCGIVGEVTLPAPAIFAVSSATLMLASARRVARR